MSGITMLAPKGQNDYYHRHNLSAIHAIDKVADIILPLVDGVVNHAEQTVTQTVTLCDFGCADGGASRPLISALIEDIYKQERSNNVDVKVIYNDQPTNNFTEILSQDNGFVSEEHRHNVAIMCCGRSFFQPCLPALSLDIGISTTALHWLSKRPCTLESSVAVIYNSTDEERAAFSEAAAKDYRQFLLHRARELRPGGHLVVSLWVQPATGSLSFKPQPLTSPGQGISFAQILTEVMATMLEDGIITKDEQRSVSFPFYERTEEELREPFQDGSPVRVAGLQLISVDIQAHDCPMFKEWEVNTCEDAALAAETHAHAYTDDLKIRSYTGLVKMLSPSRGEKERIEIADTVFSRVHDKVLEDPGLYGVGCVDAYIHITKQA